MAGANSTRHCLDLCSEACSKLFCAVHRPDLSEERKGGSPLLLTHRKVLV